MAQAGRNIKIEVETSPVVLVDTSSHWKETVSTHYITLPRKGFLGWIGRKLNIKKLSCVTKEIIQRAVKDE